MKKNMFNAGPEFWEPFEYEVHNLPADVSYYVGRKTLNLILKENMHCPEQLGVALKAEFEKVFSIGYTFGKLGKTKARLEEEDLMYRFDKKFVHFIWDNMLNDKMVFVGQDIEHLWNNVANLCPTVKVVYSGKIDKPFKIEDSDFCFRFVYYDPEYNKIMDEYNERLKVLHKQKDYLGLD